MGSKKRTRSKKKDENDDIVDERFRASMDRPQFQKPKEQASKVVLDERFASVLTDPRFRLQEKDKYGRKKKQSAENELTAFYTVERGEREEKVEKDDVSSSSDESEEGSPMQQESEHSESDNDSKTDDPASRIAYLTALSRGELAVSSSSDEDEESVTSESDSDADEEEDPVYGKAGVLDPSAEREDALSLTEELTPYMALTNLDWEHVRAVDLFAILASFTPPGSVRRVQVFPSNFGIERMAQDALYGPNDLWKKKKKEYDKNEESDGQDTDNEESEDDGESINSDGEPKEPMIQIESDHVGSDFDPEKLRAYEAAKLKYYFAVVEFASPKQADMAYREVDGMEIEHSSAAIDMRAIPREDLNDAIKEREQRDEATSLPSNYEPPDFIVNALQQTSVRCTWEDGDMERERKLTGYVTGEPDTWGSLAETDDLRAYLASDISSDDEDDEDEGSDKERSGKGANLRKLLGLDSGDDNDGEERLESSEQSSSEEEDENAFAREVTFIPGQGRLEDKIRSKLDAKKDGVEELTPWQKYQEKRKEKRRERKQARRKKGSDIEKQIQDDEMYESDLEDDGDNFFVVQDREIDNKKLRRKKSSKIMRDTLEKETSGRTPSTKAELELLLAGDDDEEEAKDYDMRGLQRIDKNKDKKLRGARKRKETELAANVSGADFKLNTTDERFAAVLDGTDDRFGIDPTDPNFKETASMREIMAEQTKRRKKKRAKTSAEKVAPTVSAEADAGTSGGAAALSSLVMSLKSKVAKRSQ